jgi:hypothetical protein
MGRTPLPWQAATLDLAAEVDGRGRLVHSVVVVLVPRRAGKTILVAGALTYRALTAPTAGYYTAQTGADASAWFRDDYLPLLDRFGGQFKPSLSNGKEAVRWRHNQARTAIFSPTRDALHGKFSDLVVIDEAWSLDAARGRELLQAIRPTMATRPGAQLWIVSAAGDPSSTFLAEQVDAARAAAAAGDPTYALVEYGVPDELDATDPAVVAEWHPAVGHTIERSFLDAERHVLGAGEFARAYGCWQPEAEVGRREIDPEQWARLADPAPMPPRLGAAVGVDVGPGRDAAAVAAVKLPDGRYQLELLGVWDTPGELPRLVDQLRGTRPRPLFGVDDAGPARNVADTIDGLDLSRLNGSQYAAACLQFADLVAAGRIVHRGQADLDAAIAALTTRPLIDGWVWSRRRATATIAAAVAATVAVWTLDHATRPKPVIRSAGDHLNPQP